MAACHQTFKRILHSLLSIYDSLYSIELIMLRVNCTLVEITIKMSCSIFPPLPPVRVHRQNCITINFLTLDMGSPPASPRFDSCPDQVLLTILYSRESQKYAKNMCAADFSLLNLPKGKSLGRSKPATDS